MTKEFMLEDPNIPRMSPSQFVHEHPINSPRVLHPACMQVSVAGAAVVPLPGGGTSCGNGGNTQNTQSISPSEKPLVPQLRHI